MVGKYPSIAVEARGLGLMLGIKIKEPYANGDLGDAARTEGLLTVVAGDNVLRLVPPLIVGEGEISEARSEEHTSELQSLMRISYAVFCLQTTKIPKH